MKLPTYFKAPYHSIIAKKITARMSIIYFGIYFLILLLIFLLITPHLYKIADQEATTTLSIMTDRFKDAQDTVSNYASTLSSYETLARNLENYSATPTEATKAVVEQTLSSYVNSNSPLLAATLENYKYEFFSSHYFRTVIDQNFSHDNPDYMKLFEYSSGSSYSYYPSELFSFKSGVSDSITQYHTLAFSKVIYFNYSPYIITLYYNLNAFFHTYQNVRKNLFTDSLILNRRHEIIYTTDSFSSEDAQKIPVLFTTAHSSDKAFSGFGIYYYQSIPSTGWAIVAYSPFSLLLQNLFIIIGLITLLYLISPILYGLLLMPALTRLLSPLAELTSSMKTYNAGDHVDLSLKTGDEIEELTNRYIDMTQKINSQIQNIKEQEHRNSVTNYKLLATQLDPHFIYNAMNTVNIVARQGKTNDVIELNSAIIKILRERLNSKLSIFDTIENELETLHQYEIIMKYRYSNHITTQVEADPLLLQKKVPKNILQPLVENAFYHGFGVLPDDVEKSIEILIYSVEHNLVIEISDNGNGITEERLELIRTNSYHIYDDKKPHIGIDNIRQRLEYVFKSDYQFDIYSTLGYGTTICITMPLELPSDSLND